MATTNFVDQQTVIEADWLNDVDAVVYPDTAKTSPSASDYVVVRDVAASNAPKKTTFSNIATYIWNNLGLSIFGGTAKTTPVDADLLAIGDSASSYASKKLTLANLKATLTPSGTYSPTLTGIDNVTSVNTNTYSWYYTRVGNIVTVTGYILVTPTVANTVTLFTATLPIASTVTSGTLLGSGVLGEHAVSGVLSIIITPYGSPGTTAAFQYRSSTSTSATSGSITFTYIVA